MADGFSIAAANYSGSRAEIEEYGRFRQAEATQIEADPEQARQEIRRIYAAKGFALATFTAFLICGFIPIMPFAFGPPATDLAAAVMTGLTVFAIGSLRSFWSLKPWWRTGSETLLIGMVAAGVAYMAGSFMLGLV